MMQILETKDYDIFKILDFNRDVNSSHYTTIKNIIIRENLLKVHPILVNLNMEVLDGQHRLAVAKELGLTVYYMIEDVDYKHIIDSNLNQKKMTTADIIKYYRVKDKNEHYTKLHRYLLRTGLSAKALSYLLGIDGGRMRQDFQLGKFQMPKNDAAMENLIVAFQELISYAINKKISPLAMLKSSYFCKGFSKLVNHPNFTMEKFLRNLDQKWFELCPKGSSREWYKTLVSIYNWKNHEKISPNDFEELE